MTNLLIYILILLFTFTSSVNACYFIKTETRIFSFKNFGNENTNGIDADEWIKNNNLSIGNIGLLNDIINVANGGGKGASSILGTVAVAGVIISGIGAYKGEEAKAIVDYGYLGNNEYMRPDGSHISGEDLKTNLKIYGTMDIGGSILMAGVPFMEGSFSKKGLGGNPFKGKTDRKNV